MAPDGQGTSLPPGACTHDSHDWEIGHPVTTADGHVNRGYRCTRCGLGGYWVFVVVEDGKT